MKKLIYGASFAIPAALGLGLVMNEPYLGPVTADQVLAQPNILKNSSIFVGDPVTRYNQRTKQIEKALEVISDDYISEEELFGNREKISQTRPFIRLLPEGRSLRVNDSDVYHSKLSHILKKAEGSIESKRRFSDKNLKELIIALDHNMEAEATTRYITERIENPKLKITRLARGLPTGGDIEFADAMTLSAAFSGRRKL